MDQVFRRFLHLEDRLDGPLRGENLDEHLDDPGRGELLDDRFDDRFDDPLRGENLDDRFDDPGRGEPALPKLWQSHVCGLCSFAVGGRQTPGAM